MIANPILGLARSIRHALVNIHTATGEDIRETIYSEKNYSIHSQSQENQAPSSASQVYCEAHSQSDRNGTRKPQVHIVMEMFNSFKHKPAKMITFLCCQDFRRDQFPSHYKNVHLDIQSGKYVLSITCTHIYTPSFNYMVELYCFNYSFQITSKK